MKIQKIEFENFRNFKDHGIIEFATDGTVTIIYGKNGDGKTTLHQLLQWVFYNEVHFNKTASDKMYNHEFEAEQSYGTIFHVFACLDFEHNNERFSLRREWVYRKELEDSKRISEDVTLSKRDNDNNWNRLDNPNEIINELLPSGLSQYFFFDGENMISDLRVKGKESATKLRQALYSMFDLDVLERAIAHIGTTELKTTVLGQLYLSKAVATGNGDAGIRKNNIENAQLKIENLKNLKQRDEEEERQKRESIQSISEEIGTNKSKVEYEHQRKQLKEQSDLYLKLADKAQAAFGDEVISTFPKMLLSKTIAEARNKIFLEMEKSELMPGINRTLINKLLDADICICGNPLCDKDKDHLREYLTLLPPMSFKGLYDNFTRNAEHWGKQYDRSRLEDHIKQVLDYRSDAAKRDQEIHNLDEEQKKSKDVQKLIEDRQIAENRIDELKANIIKFEVEISKYNIYLRKEMKEFDKIASENEQNRRVEEKIAIMQEVKEYFEHRLEKASDTYSKKLKNEIETLLGRMLTSNRNVAVTPDFFLRVYDSYNDEAKSEGQFAVISFAYIGGILKLLKEESSLEGKEYPLVLDGPFSKLDYEQRQNVIDTLPEYAPQVILFSKDNLQSYFSPNKIGRVWTLSSNAEKNVSEVKEGFLWK